LGIFFKKQEGKNGGKKKKRFFYVHGGSHSRVFSISQKHPRPHVTLPQENPLTLEPPLQHNMA
jgi:hypothetical protein